MLSFTRFTRMIIVKAERATVQVKLVLEIGQTDTKSDSHIDCHLWYRPIGSATESITVYEVTREIR